MAMLVRHAMTEAPKGARPDMSAADAAGLMKQMDVGVVPVRDGERLLGLVTDRDLVLRVMAGRRDPTTVPLSDVMTSHTISVSPDQHLSEAQQLMAEHKIRRLPVVKGEELVGILSLGDVAMATASERMTGETLREISDSRSTQPAREGPDPGTPERVRALRAEDADVGS